MRIDIGKFLLKCRPCEKYGPVNYKEKLKPHKVPKDRMEKIGMDILEYGGNAYLVIVDYYSQWIDIYLLPNKSSNAVIEAMRQMFKYTGYPVSIICDNVPFNSSECQKYFKAKDINLRTSTPHHAQSNGRAEKAVGIVKKMMKKCQEDGSNIYEAIMAYNNTPIIKLGASPSQILNSRVMRGEDPIIREMIKPHIQEGIYEKLCNIREESCKQYDKTSRKEEKTFKEGDNITVRTRHDNCWEKAKVLRKAEEPRSYYVQLEKNDRIVRRNTWQMKKSFTKIGAEKEYQDFGIMNSNKYMTRRNEDERIEEEENIEIIIREERRNNIERRRKQPETIRRNQNNRTTSRYGRTYKPNKKYTS